MQKQYIGQALIINPKYKTRMGNQIKTKMKGGDVAGIADLDSKYDPTNYMNWIKGGLSTAGTILSFI